MVSFDELSVIFFFLYWIKHNARNSIIYYIFPCALLLDLYAISSNNALLKTFHFFLRLCFSWHTRTSLLCLYFLLNRKNNKWYFFLFIKLWFHLLSGQLHQNDMAMCAIPNVHDEFLSLYIIPYMLTHALQPNNDTICASFLYIYAVHTNDRIKSSEEKEERKKKEEKIFR